MATLPGLPPDDEPEPDSTLPVDPDDGYKPVEEPGEPPDHRPVEPPRA